MSLLATPNSMGQALTSWCHVTSVTSLKTVSPDFYTLVVRASRDKFWGDAVKYIKGERVVVFAIQVEKNLVLEMKVRFSDLSTVCRRVHKQAHMCLQSLEWEHQECTGAQAHQPISRVRNHRIMLGPLQL